MFGRAEMGRTDGTAWGWHEAIATGSETQDLSPSTQAWVNATHHPSPFPPISSESTGAGNSPPNSHGSCIHLDSMIICMCVLMLTWWQGISNRARHICAPTEKWQACGGGGGQDENCLKLSKAEWSCDKPCPCLQAHFITSPPLALHHPWQQCEAKQGMKVGCSLWALPPGWGGGRGLPTLEIEAECAQCQGRDFY